MGTTYNVSTVFRSVVSDVDLLKIKRAVHQSLVDVDVSMSTYKADSEVSNFNRLPVGDSISMSDGFSDVMTLAVELSNTTNGYFDVSVAPLVRLWGFGAGSVNEQSLPSSARLAEAKEMVGMDKLAMADKKLTKVGRVELDLSAVAKGFAADKVGGRLDDLGVKNYMVEVGGEVVVKGFNRKGSKWVLGIEKPDKNFRTVYTAVGISGVGMATSGDYRNFRVVEGESYSHTIDPVIGEPVKTKLASVTVISDSCARADALATALMAMGETQAFAFADEHRLSAFFIVRHDNKFESRSTASFNKYVL